MSKIAVVYWSGTGNTEAMAEEVANGAKAAGAEVESFTTDDFAGYTALVPSSSSILSNWLYFATRSDLEGAPVLIWQVLSATARSAIVVSSVSPER